MVGTLVPDELQAKVALEAITCVTQLDDLAIVTVTGKDATYDVQMFGVNSKWSTNLHIWGKGGLVTVGKDTKTGNKGTKMMFVGYGKHESDSVCMWDP